MNVSTFVPVINATYRLTRAVRRINSPTTTPFGTLAVVLDIDLNEHQALVEVNDPIRPRYNGQRYVVPFGMLNPANLFYENNHLIGEVALAYNRQTDTL